MSVAGEGGLRCGVDPVPGKSARGVNASRTPVSDASPAPSHAHAKSLPPNALASDHASLPSSREPAVDEGAAFPHQPEWITVAVRPHHHSAQESIAVADPALTVGTLQPLFTGGSSPPPGDDVRQRSIGLYRGRRGTTIARKLGVARCHVVRRARVSCGRDSAQRWLGPRETGRARGSARLRGLGRMTSGSTDASRREGMA